MFVTDNIIGNTIQNLDKLQDRVCARCRAILSQTTNKELENSVPKICFSWSRNNCFSLTIDLQNGTKSFAWAYYKNYNLIYGTKGTNGQKDPNATKEGN